MFKEVTFINLMSTSRIANFAEEHNLEMRLGMEEKKFYARFANVCLKCNGMLGNICGTGSTPEEAADDYARQIELQTIVVDDAKEIVVPSLF